MESDFEFEYQMSLRLVHKLLSKVKKIKRIHFRTEIILVFQTQVCRQPAATHGDVLEK